MPSPPIPNLQELLRQLPQVERLLRLPEVEALADNGSRGQVTEVVREILARVRGEILNGTLSSLHHEPRLSGPGLVREIECAVAARRQSAYRRVINATGVVLHTGLGRAVFSAAALESLSQELAGYSVVEVDIESGERNKREEALIEILRKLTGAESATVVNNNAGATLLILAALARGKEVIVSRGQLVEIGGSFRIPDILRESGAKLVEVGSTNRTYASDYRNALTAETAMLLQVHTSNYEIAGFVHHTPLEELVELGRQQNLSVVSDLGSGCFVDLSPYGFKREPLASESIARGADVVCFSGDKLLGGPQCGIIVGKDKSIQKLRAHPLFRTLRVDKCTCITLEATLRAYLDPERLIESIPTLRMIAEPAESVRQRAEACRVAVLARGCKIGLEVVPSSAQAGSGALPTQSIASFALRVSHPALSPDALARALRLSSPPVLPRIHDGHVLLDFRTVQEQDRDALALALSQLADRV